MAGSLPGLQVSVFQVLLLVVILFVAATSFSAIDLFLAVVSRITPAVQTLSSMITMPLTFVSGAYIPTTVIPQFLTPIVYLNPLTCVASCFRYAALGAWAMTSQELVKQGMTFSLNGFVSTPQMGLGITVLIGTVFLVLCVRKSDKADFSTVRVPNSRRGAGVPA